MRPSATLRSDTPAVVALIDRASGSGTAKPALVSVDAKSLLEMARNSVSGGKFTAKVPLRIGEAALPIAGGVRLDIPSGASCDVTATISPTSEGLKIARARVVFNQP